jgi:NADPH-dependent curcumin reductase CurA
VAVPSTPERSGGTAPAPSPLPGGVGEGLACDVCGATENLSRCTRCKGRHYCSVAHQREDWVAGGHKFLCGASNAQVLLAKRPKLGQGPLDKTCLELRSAAPLPQGELVVRNLFLSLDPYMRGRMSDAPSYAAPQPLGQPMPGETIGLVVSSSSARFAVGTHVRLMGGGWQKYVACSAADAQPLAALAPELPLSAHLSALGMPAVTAWHMVERILKPVAGEAFLVSAASGAVGQVAAQLAALRGATVIGLAGSEDKCKQIARFCKHALNYRDFDNSSAKLAARLKQLAPDGIHCYADNTGGWILNAAMSAAAVKGRIAVCGRVALYDAGAEGAITEPTLILTRQLTIQGFIVPADAFELGRPELARLLAAGSLRCEETVVEGLEAAVDAFASLFDKGSSHLGKLIVKV